MDPGPPAPHVSVLDSNRPMKRRRPALSCTECRKRKVKCDRKKPCGPCTRMKLSTCTYRPIAARTDARPQSRSTTPPIVSAGPASQEDTPEGIVQSNKPSQQTIDFNALINRYIAPGILGPHDGVALSCLPKERGGGNGGLEGVGVQLLTDRVKVLEEKIARLEGRDGALEGSLPMSRAASVMPAGQFVKSKFYGESHWVNCIEPYDALGQSFTNVNPNNNRTEVNKSSELYFALVECKRLARMVKRARASPQPVIQELSSSLPSKEVCNELVRAYIRTFEGVFRVLHIPTFLSEYDGYWKDPATTKQSSFLKILLVFAIGVPFYTGEGQGPLRAACAKWIQAADNWLNGPHGKSRINLTGIQIHILVLLARQVSSVDGDLVWISAGSLLRSAMHLGLHREPSHFPKISTFHCEMRRRLWATVLEVTVQTSLDIGMPPMLSEQDYDTLPPSNLNDDQISETHTTQPIIHPAGTYTQTTIQITMLQTLPLRLQITRQINNIRTEISYPETLRLGFTLTNICRTTLQFLQPLISRPPNTSTNNPTPFQVKLLDVFIRRFILMLHRPFFAKATTNPEYHFSRKVCVDVSLSILSPAFGNESLREEDDYYHLTTRGVGFQKWNYIYSASTIYLELNTLIEEEKQNNPSPAFLNPSDQARGRRMFVPPRYDELRSVLVESGEITKRRIQNGETNAKGCVFFACGVARLDALVEGRDDDVDGDVLVAARVSIKECDGWMRQAYKDEWGIDVDTVSMGGFRERTEYKEHGEGDGEGGLETGLGGGVDGGEVLGFGSGDMDWESLMRDDSLDFGFGFDGSPEGWFLGDGDGFSSFGL